MTTKMVDKTARNSGGSFLSGVISLVFLLFTATTAFSGEINPSEASEGEDTFVQISFACDTPQGFCMENDHQTNFGHMVTLAVENTVFTPDFGILIPKDNGTWPPKGMDVMGVVNTFYWGGGVTDSIYISMQVSTANKQKAVMLANKNWVNTNVYFNITVWAYDPEAQKWYKRLHTGGVPLFGQVESNGEELNFSIADDPSPEVNPPLNFTLSIGIVPPEYQQTIYLGVAFGNEIQLHWGPSTFGLSQANREEGSEDGAMLVRACGCQSADSDGDCVPNVYDNCTGISNQNQLDTDSDLIGDACDNCPNASNTSQVDSDSDLIGDACDNCPYASNTSQLDTDLDGIGNACDDNDDGDLMPDISDCQPLDENIWSIPSPATNTLFTPESTFEFNWSAPAIPGCTTIQYDIIRSANPSSFASALCVASDITALTFQITETPAPDSCYFYLVRAENSCGGNMGTNSEGIPRTGVDCPP